jgi:hypothetical protein
MTLLRQRMIEDMQARNFSPVSIRLYIDAVVKFFKFFHKSPALLRPEEIRTCQLYLIHEKKASWSAFNIAVSALRFLYVVSLEKDWAFKKIPYAKRPQTKPVILSLEEVCSFIKGLINLKYRVLVMLAYSTGLRISEVLHLRVCEIIKTPLRMSLRQLRYPLLYGGFPFSTLSVAERVHISFLTCFHRFDAVPAIPTTKTPAMPISRLYHTAFALAVYASRPSFPATSKTRLRLVDNLYRVGLFTHWNILKGFIIMAPVTPPFLGLSWRDGIVGLDRDFRRTYSAKRIGCTAAVQASPCVQGKLAAHLIGIGRIHLHPKWQAL